MINVHLAILFILGDIKAFQSYVNQALTELISLHNFPAENILQLLAYSYNAKAEGEDNEITDDSDIIAVDLVYLYMVNGSVADRLRRKGGTEPLSWEQRSNIALGTARGLLHLHSHKIIHGDIKSGNILLDKHFEPKIGDFGLARGGDENDLLSYILASSVQGTKSYLPDDYCRSRQLTEQVDTFCYGMLLFELVMSLKTQNHIKICPMITIQEGQLDFYKTFGFILGMWEKSFVARP